MRPALAEVDECAAAKDDRQRREEDRADLVRAAMESILRGDFDNFVIALAEREGVMVLAKVRG